MINWKLVIGQSVTIYVALQQPQPLQQQLQQQLPPPLQQQPFQSEFVIIKKKLI